MSEVVNSSQWRKGESGNKKGRPPKSRILAQALRETGADDSYSDLSNQQLLARMVWEGLALGTITFVGGKTLDLNAKEWLELVKWVHSHVDGNYRPEPDEQEEKPAPIDPFHRTEVEQLAFEERMEQVRQGYAEARRLAEAAPQTEVTRQTETARQDEELITISASISAAPVIVGRVEFALSDDL